MKNTEKQKERGREREIKACLFGFADDCGDSSGGFRKDGISVNSI